MRIIIYIIIAAGFWTGFTRIFEMNTRIDSAHEAYSEKKYQVAIDNLDYLWDSLAVKNPGVQLNIAHSNYHLNGFSGPNGTNLYRTQDSSYLSRTQSAFYEYTQLWEAGPVIASRGYHQSGMVTFKSRIVNNKIAEEPQLIRSSMDYFKNALRKDPNNEKARYNYEILKKYEKFPEMLMKRVRNLVNLRRYAEAYEILAPYAGRQDGRFDQEYIKRLGDIVKIEQNIQ